MLIGKIPVIYKPFIWSKRGRSALRGLVVFTGLLLCTLFSIGQDKRAISKKNVTSFVFIYSYLLSTFSSFFFTFFHLCILFVLNLQKTLIFLSKTKKKNISLTRLILRHAILCQFCQFLFLFCFCHNCIKQRILLIQTNYHRFLLHH